MAISDFLTHRDFSPREVIFLGIDPATQFGHMGDGEGGVERVSSQGRVMVPVYDWTGWGLDEEAILAKVLVAAASASPLKVPSLASIDASFWAKTPGVRAVLSHPETGEFQSPVEVIASPEVPLDRVIVIKNAAMAGYYVKQAARRNVLAHSKMGLLSVEFFRP
jgi:hypothetical protein